MTLDSSLLYTREDGSQEFVHETVKEFFAAKKLYSSLTKGPHKYAGLADRLIEQRRYVLEAYSGLKTEVEVAVPVSAFNNIFSFLVEMLPPNRLIVPLVNRLHRSCTYFKENLWRLSDNYSESMGDLRSGYHQLYDTCIFVGNSLQEIGVSNMTKDVTVGLLNTLARAQSSRPNNINHDTTIIEVLERIGGKRILNPLRRIKRGLYISTADIGDGPCDGGFDEAYAEDWYADLRDGIDKIIRKHQRRIREGLE